MENLEVMTNRARQITGMFGLSGESFSYLIDEFLFPHAISHIAERNFRLVCVVTKVEGDGYLYYFERSFIGMES